MVAKKKQDVTLFDIEYQGDKREKLPTLQQYVKLNKSSKDSVSNVDVIWFPGRFRNFTIQTDVLRASIQPTNRLFSALESKLDEILTFDKGISLRITATKPISFVLSRNEIVGRWERIGDAGIKFFGPNLDDEDDFEL